MDCGANKSAVWSVVMSTMRFDFWQNSEGEPVTNEADAQTDFGG